jgi:uncharacterized cupredoxin-like copper-binding protein
MIPLRRATVVIGCMLLALGAGPPPAPPRVPVTVTEFKFTPNTVTLTEGRPVTLVVTNTGQIEHTMASAYLASQRLTLRGESREGETDTKWKFVGIDPGETAEITFTPRGHGRFPFMCSIEGHAEAGMTGTFVVSPP